MEASVGVSLPNLERLRAHYATQRERAFQAGDRIGEAVLGRVLQDFDTMLRKEPMAKVNIGQLLMIVTVVQAFVTTVQSKWKGATTHAAKRAVIVEAVIDALPVIETITGKELVDNAKFKAAITAVADLFLKAPDRA